MADLLIQDSTLTTIANAIRTKTGKSAAIPVTEMDEEILSIETDPEAGSISLNDLTINTTTGVVTASATLTKAGWIDSAPANKTLQLSTQAAKKVTPSSSEQTAVAAGKYTIGDVTVDAIQTETKALDAGTANIDVTPTSGKYLTKVTVRPTPTESKTITPNAAGQTIMPSTGKYLSQVVINGDADLVAGNIKKGVEIFGVTGTFEGGITPTGTLNITANGDYNVTNYAQAHVAIPAYDGSVVVE